jgi:hypothetical protein
MAFLESDRRGLPGADERAGDQPPLHEDAMLLAARRASRRVDPARVSLPKAKAGETGVRMRKGMVG